MDEELGLSFSDMMKAVKRRWLMIVVIPMIVALLTFVYINWFTVDMYTAQVKLYTLFDYIDNTGTTRFDLSSSQYFVSDYQELIQTNEVMNETCRRLGWERFPAGTSYYVNAVNDTRLIAINFTSTSPVASMQAANMLAIVFTEYVQGLLQTDSVRIASEATLPTHPSNGGRAIYIPLAFAAALAMMIAAVIALEMLNTKVRADRDAEMKLQANVLTQVASYKKEMTDFLKQRKSRESNLLECVSEYTQESIKKLALNIEFASMGRELHTLTVTSTTPKEGKSSVSLMLACELAKEGNSVLLVDMDYRSPMIGRYLGRRNKKDIFDYMSGNAKLTDVIARTNTPDLYFMDSNHRIALNANLEAFDRFIEESRNYFDIVIFDTAPLGMFIDAASLAAKSDGTLVIVADGRVEQKELKKVLTQLQQVKANVLGIAFNFVNHKEKNYYYNRYYRYGKHHKAEHDLTDPNA